MFSRSRRLTLISNKQPIHDSVATFCYRVFYESLGSVGDGQLEVGGDWNAPARIGGLGAGCWRKNGYWYLGWRQLGVGQQLATGTTNTLAGNSTAGFIPITSVVRTHRG
jgi:hypothetical protein